MGFQRARSDEQREERRQVILATASRMLAEMPVAQLSLNELSRRVGLAKSNVLRYFESREAILLELLNAELRIWAAQLRGTLGAIQAGEVRERADRVAAELASTLAGRPALCDLISAQAAVLERNISTEVALRHKRATAETVDELIGALRWPLPELSAADAYRLIAMTLLTSSAIWPHSQPSEALAAAYATDPAIAANHQEFDVALRQTLEILITGILVRR